MGIIRKQHTLTMFQVPGGGLFYDKIDLEFYLLSNEPITDGDWFIKLRDVYPTGLGPLHLCTEGTGNYKRTDKGWTLQAKHGNEVVLKKIVATTNKSIGYTDRRVSPVSNFCDFPNINREIIQKLTELGGTAEVMVDYKETYDIRYFTPPGGVECSEKYNQDIRLVTSPQGEVNISFV